MSALWTHITAAEATGGKAQGAWQAARVEIDSRRIRPGDLFVALKGERFDGHAYIAEAFKNGAAAAMVSTAQGEGNFLLVGDTQKAMEALGRCARGRSTAKIVGITGSVGKTSAKEMLRLALSAHGKTFAGAGNYNNHIGTPYNLANLPPDAEFAVFEMGMNHAGEITPLTQMVQPHVAAITNIEAVHQEFFPSIEAIAEAKAEIFMGIPAGGAAVLNRDSIHYYLLAARARGRGIERISSFGVHEQADCRLLAYDVMGEGVQLAVGMGGEILTYKLGAIGRHWALASLLVLLVAQVLGLDAKKTAQALAQFSEPEGRGRIMPLKVKGGEAFLIDDSYNASPASMRAAFAKMAELGGKGRRLAALGDMLELGSDAPKLHAALAKDMQGFDRVWTAGTLMRHLHEALPQVQRGDHKDDAMQLLPLLLAELGAGDMVLIKGSHGSRMYALAKALADATGEKKNAV